ncbi:MAG TPA: hypothetical protein PLY93_11400, partial [Turneriella sp.]|nr:hypothetical protein [Turneriella sp.]
KSTHRSCLYLRAFAFAMQDDFDTAYNLIKKIKRGMREIDNRLLYLIVAVGANKEDISALKRFIHRQSYRENASSLRRLAQKILLS